MSEYFFTAPYFRLWIDAKYCPQVIIEKIIFSRMDVLFVLLERYTGKNSSILSIEKEQKITVQFGKCGDPSIFNSDQTVFQAEIISIEAVSFDKIMAMGPMDVDVIDLRATVLIKGFDLKKQETLFKILKRERDD